MKNINTENLYMFTMIDNGSSAVLLDKKRLKIFDLSFGISKDITKDCEKMYTNYLNKKSNKKMGCIAFQFIHNMANEKNLIILDNERLFQTNNQTEFDFEVFKVKKNQIEFQLKMLNENVFSLENNKKYSCYY